MARSGVRFEMTFKIVLDVESMYTDKYEHDTSDYPH